MIEVARIIHISDLHFTDIDPETGEPVYGEESLEPAALPAFEGFAGHRLRALKALHRWNSEHGFRPESSGVRSHFLAFTGDLTAFGASNQFESGIQFFEGNFVRTEFEAGLGFGCATAFWRRSAIPGNHDWFPWGDRRNLFRSHPRGSRRTTALQVFRSTPYVGCFGDLGRHCKFLLIGVNTDCDIWDDTPTKFGDKMFRRRLLAKGHCVSELHKLNETLPKHKNMGREVRILLLHHSIEYSSPWFKAREFVEDSANSLRKLIKNSKIDIVLSGHIHKPVFKKIDLDGHCCYEIRCGTTAQHLELPDGWRQTGSAVARAASNLMLSGSARRAYEHLLDERRRKPVKRDRANVLLDHYIRLTDGGTKLVWQTQTWAEHNGAFLKRNDLLPTDKPLLLWSA